MVRPDMFACLFDRENSRYRQELIYGLVFNAGGFKLLKDIVGNYGGLSW